jgi:hypothetical protein
VSTTVIQISSLSGRDEILHLADQNLFFSDSVVPGAFDELEAFVDRRGYSLATLPLVLEIYRRAIAVLEAQNPKDLGITARVDRWVNLRDLRRELQENHERFLNCAGPLCDTSYPYLLIGLETLLSLKKYTQVRELVLDFKRGHPRIYDEGPSSALVALFHAEALSAEGEERSAHVEYTAFLVTYHEHDPEVGFRHSLSVGNHWQRYGGRRLGESHFADALALALEMGWQDRAFVARAALKRSRDLLF